MEADDTLYTLKLGDFEEQLTVHGVRLERLGAGDVNRLRELYAYDEDAQWKLFESIAIAAQSFASQLANREDVVTEAGGNGDGDLTPLTPRWVWDALEDAGNTTSPRLGTGGELLVTAYAQTETGGCGDLLGDFVITCERVSPEHDAVDEPAKESV